MRKLPITIVLLSIAACGSDDNPGGADGAPPSVDAAAQVADAAVEYDANPACPNPTGVLPLEWRPLNIVSTSVVEDLGDGSYYIDGSAGGLPNAAENPSVYLRLEAATIAKVEITDVDALGSMQWDLAIKRSVIRSNGGDSGPGGVSVAAVDVASLDDVTTLPAEGVFSVDDWVSDDCEYISGQIGEPGSAIGVWYTYANASLTPLERVYVVRRADQTAFKVKILTYYHNDIGSAHYELSWAPM